MSTQNSLTIPQFGRGISSLQEAQAKREETQKEIAQKKSSEGILRQTLDVIRRDRMTRVENTARMITGLLNGGKYREAEQVTLNEIHRMLDELKMFADPKDRLWVAKKILHFTSWRGMKALNDAEEVLTSVFGKNIPDEIAESLARLIEKQTEYLRKIAKRNSGVMRDGKTQRDRNSGALKQHRDNKAFRAEENRQRAHGGDNSNKNSKK
ncbi:MAG: hypothetical protein HZB09_02385 [Candidatus Yonathbacteria bacterium]|nr:hypothetical protein [Candidatus Yonathbacteria bacterium]